MSAQVRSDQIRSVSQPVSARSPSRRSGPFSRPPSVGYDVNTAGVGCRAGPVRFGRTRPRATPYIHRHPLPVRLECSAPVSHTVPGSSVGTPPPHSSSRVVDSRRH